MVGGMMVIELLAGTMRLDRISPEAVGRAAKRALCGVRNCRGGNERMEDWIIFFAWGGGAMSHLPVPLIEDDCAA